jgi:peptidoglycan/LPS O-acetylase OafA/YrhL
VAGRQVVGRHPPPESRCRDRCHRRISLAAVVVAAAAVAAAASITPAAAMGPPVIQAAVPILATILLLLLLLLLLLTPIDRQPAPLASRGATAPGVTAAGAEG